MEKLVGVDAGVVLCFAGVLVEIIIQVVLNNKKKALRFSKN